MRQLRLIAVAGAAVAAIFGGAAAPVAIANQPAPVQDCDAARAAYDKALSQLDARAKELGVSKEDADRLRASVEAKGKDGVIDDQESAELLQDPVVQRVSTQFRASDLDLIKKVASAHNALLRCSDNGANVTTAPPTSSATTAPPSSVPSSATSSAAPPRGTTGNGVVGSGNVDDKGQPIVSDNDRGTAPVGGIETGNGGMADVLAN